MNESEQKVTEILTGIVNAYKMKGSISTNALCDVLEKYNINADQMDFIYKSIGEAGIQIVDEAKSWNMIKKKAVIRNS